MPRDVPPHRVSILGDNAPAPASNPTPPLTYTPSSDRQPGPSTSSQPDDLNDEQKQMLAELEAAEASRQEMVAQVRKDNCERARRVLENLTNIGRVRVIAEDGTRSVLPEEERNARIAEAQRGIATNC